MTCFRDLRVAAVFNECNDGTIPFENFLHTNIEGGKKLVVSWSQTDKQLDSAVRSFSQTEDIGWIGLGECSGVIAKARVLFSRLKEFHPDVIHTHHALSSLMISVLKPKLEGKLLLTIHSNFSQMRIRHKVFFALACRAADLIICNSAATQSSLKKYGRFLFSRVPSCVIYNGVNERKVGVRKERVHRVTDETPQIISVARFVLIKDHETLVRAFAGVCEGLPRAHLTLIGDGPTRPGVERLVRALGLAGRVEFTGEVLRNHVYERLRNSDIFVVTSHSEGFCNAMVEAALAGIPIIATNITSLREVLGGRAAAFFSPGNHVELSKSITKVWGNYRRHLIEAKNNRPKLISRYGLDVSSAAYAQAYQRIGAHLTNGR